MDSQASALRTAVREAARKLVGPTLIAVVSVAIVAMVAVGSFRSEADKNIAEWLQAARHQTPPDSAALAEASRPPADLAERLTQQITEIRRDAFYHLTVAKGFSRYQFSSVTMSTLAAVLAGILLVPISWKGWQQADPWFVAFFLAFAAAGTVFSASSRIYRQNESIGQHSALYSNLLSLEDEVLTFRATTHEPEDSARFVAHVDSALASMRTLGPSSLCGRPQFRVGKGSRRHERPSREVALRLRRPLPAPGERAPLH